MADNITILGDAAALVQIISDDFSATNGHLEDSEVKIIKNSRLRNSKSLTSVNFPNVTTIEANVFNGCSNLHTILLPNLTSITGGYSFNNNTSLDELRLPKLTTTTTDATFRDLVVNKLILPVLTSHRNWQFNNSKAWLMDLGYISTCSNNSMINLTNLTTLILRKSDSICVNSNSSNFNNTKYAASGAGGAYVYVPRNLISTYQAATNWVTLYAAHSDMFRPLEDYTVDGTTTGEFDESMIMVPSNPIYVATNYEYATGKQITTTADSHITLTGGNGSFTQFMVSDTGITNHRTWFNIPSGSTIRVTIRGLTSDVWGTTPRFSLISLNNPVVDFSVDDLRAVFNSESSTVDALSVEYTNSSGSAVPIEGFRIAHHLTSGKVLDFKVSAVMDGQRVF